jgi:hypothetical protein
MAQDDPGEVKAPPKKDPTTAKDLELKSPNDAPKKDDEKPKDDKPKDDKPKDDKPKDDDKKADAPPPKKAASFDDGDPLISDSDYYYGDDPYFVRRHPSSQPSRLPPRQSPRLRMPKQ